MSGSLRSVQAIRTAATVAAVCALACASTLPLTGCASWRGVRLYQSGTRALEAGDVEGALADLQQAAHLVPEASEIQNHLGLAWLAAGDEMRALQSFDRALALDCDNRAAGENRARLEARWRRRAIDRVSGGETPQHE